MFFVPNLFFFGLHIFGPEKLRDSTEGVGGVGGRFPCWGQTLQLVDWIGLEVDSDASLLVLLFRAIFFDQKSPVPPPLFTIQGSVPWAWETHTLMNVNSCVWFCFWIQNEVVWGNNLLRFMLPSSYSSGISNISEKEHCLISWLQPCLQNNTLHQTTQKTHTKSNFYCSCSFHALLPT